MCIDSYWSDVSFNLCVAADYISSGATEAARMDRWQYYCDDYGFGFKGFVDTATVYWNECPDELFSYVSGFSRALYDVDHRDESALAGLLLMVFDPKKYRNICIV